MDVNTEDMNLKFIQTSVNDTENYYVNNAYMFLYNWK